MLRMLQHTTRDQWIKHSRMWTMIVVVMVLLSAGLAGGIVLWQGKQLSRQAQPKLTMAKAYLNGTLVRVELARTADEQNKGLSFRPSLGTDEGMLFLFSQPQPQIFWMYGMRFPLDIIFLKSGRVVNIASTVPAGRTLPATVASAGLADMVLELNAGRAAEIGIATGTILYLEP